MRFSTRNALKLKHLLVFVVCIVIVFLGIKAERVFWEIKTIYISTGYLELSKVEVMDIVQAYSNSLAKSLLVDPSINPLEGPIINTDRKYNTLTSIQELQEGDILIRRKLNANTTVPNIVFPTYFTHTAYIGPNQTIYEAVGNLKHDADEILISEITKSDWIDHNPDPDSIFVLRPRLTIDQIKQISAELRRIAEDDSYRFGVRSERDGVHEQEQILLCTSYISDTLTKLGIIEQVPSITTPDYIFKSLLENEGFDIVEVMVLKP